MRNLAKLKSALIGGLLGVGGFALAQIATSFQLSQDPRGNFGTNGAHLIVSNVPPVATNCGTAPTVAGNDSMGTFTTGSAATTCTLTFKTAWVTAPTCVISNNGGNATQPTFTVSTTAITITVDIASTAYSYICQSTG